MEPATAAQLASGLEGLACYLNRTILACSRVENPYTYAFSLLTPVPGWRNGRRSGLKIHR